MILVDTSAWVDFFLGRGMFAEVVARLLEENQVAICGPVLTEIHRGISLNKDRAKIHDLFSGCHMLRQPENLWEEAGTLGFLVRKRNAKTKSMDLLIACYALAHRIPLLTGDSDFKRIRNAGINLELVS